MPAWSLAVMRAYGNKKLFDESVIAAALLATWAIPATADIYRCKNGDGVTFQSSPCAVNEAQVVVQQAQHPPQPDSSRSKPIKALTASDLVGTWRADHGGGLSEEWLISADGWLTHRNYKGQTIRSKYSISHGTIVVHHQPALASEYDEEMTITRWTGTEMEWRSMFGTLVKAQRR